MSKLINVGSLCIDYVYTVPSLVCSGETLASSRREVFPGGKGLNQSIAAAEAGCEVQHVGNIGPDGADLVACLAERGVNTERIARTATPTGHAFIQVDLTGQNAIIIHGGSNRILEPHQWNDSFAEAQPGDLLLLQHETNAIDQIIRDASARDLRIAINLAPADESVRALPIELTDVLIVNEAEAMALSGDSSSEAAFATLSDRFPRTTVVMTLGREGLHYAAPTSEGSTSGFLPAFQVDSVDETAAGDAFVGYFMANLVSGTSLETALLYGAAAGALAVTKEGAAPSIPSLKEVAQLTSSESAPSIEAKN
ncbi:MAG: ribokinase [Pseudomonadales bacterium]|nr:ribokinase [Pseudomonadales bacterium]